ncbi:MAG: type II toxin-antitoxin system RelE/ParE family toxin [Cyclobacteriaceae bacterium]|nr:type II toxin-antitoxin system RelE/ParE family toxin [Cyclobacteriaceae bacterium]
MAQLKVIWTNTAYKQRNLIFNYWNKRNGNNNYSKKLLIKINQRVKHISIFPEIGKQVDFKNTRAVSLGHFSILYQIQNDSIIVTAFWDNRDDPEKLVKMLKK